MDHKLKIIVIASIFFLVGGFIGGVIGFYTAVNVIIKAGLNILPQFTNITINEEAIRDALFTYNERIGGSCGVLPNLTYF